MVGSVNGAVGLTVRRCLDKGSFFAPKVVS